MENYDVLALSTLLANKTESHIQVRLNDFECSRDRDLEEFIHKLAIPYEKRDRSRTFLIARNNKTIAYISLAMTVLRHENLSSNVSRKLIDSMDFRKGVTSAFLIGQLCEADGTKEKVGPELFELAFNMFRKTRRTVGCRVVAIDCKESLISYYEQFGFRIISDINPETHLYRMAMLLSRKTTQPDT